MPDAAEYQQGFDLKVGQVYAQYRMDDIKIGHTQLVRWNEYEYPSTMTFRWTGSYAGTKSQADEKTLMALFEAFKAKIDGIKIIYTAKGTPYKCLFQYPQTTAPGYRATADFTGVTLVYKGFGKRIGKAEVDAIQSGKQGWDK